MLMVDYIHILFISPDIGFISLLAEVVVVVVVVGGSVITLGHLCAALAREPPEVWLWLRPGSHRRTFQPVVS